MLKSLFALCLGLSSTLAFAATPVNPPINLKAPPILIGAIYNMTGRQMMLDQASARGANLAVQQINAAGGVLGRPLQLLLKDGETNPEHIHKVAYQFAKNPDVSVVIGINSSDGVMEAAPEIANAGKLFITSGATSPALSKIAPEQVFLVCFSDNAQAAAAAEYSIDELKAKTTVLLADADSVYTQGVSKYFSESYTKLGGKIIFSAKFNHANPSIQAQVAQLKALSPAPELIYVAATDTAEAAAIVKQLRAAGFKQPIMGSDSFDSPDLVKFAGPAANDVYYTTHALINAKNPDPEVQAFIKAYTAMYQHAPGNAFAALGYDAVELSAKAIAQAKSTEPKKIQQVLEQIKDFRGVTGDISYATDTTIPVKTITIVRVINGAPKLAKAFIPKQVPAP